MTRTSTMPIATPTNEHEATIASCCSNCVSSTCNRGQASAANVARIEGAVTKRYIPETSRLESNITANKSPPIIMNMMNTAVPTR